MTDTPTPRLRPARALRAAVLLASTLTAATSQAQMGPEEGPGGPVTSGQTLREVVISSRRSIEERFQAAGSLVVVDRQDIEQMGVDTTVDVLRQLPGLQVTTGANGGIEIRMRGLDGSATRVMIDGQRSAGRAQLPIDQLPADLIERIEIVRSPSAEFSGSSGGTVNIVLRQASPQRSAMFRLTDHVAFGDHNPRLWLMRTGPIGGDPQTPSRPPWSFFMGVWLADSISGFDQELESQSPTALSRSDARSRTERRDWMLIPRLSGRIGRDQVSLRGNISGSSSDGSYLQRLSDGSTLRSETSKTERDSWQLGGDWTRRLGVGKLESSWSGNRQSDELLRQRASGSRYDEDRTESTWQLKSKLTGSRESLLWMTGIDYENRQAHGSSLDSTGSAGLERLQSRIERLALWGQNEWELPAKTTLTLGLRGESVRLQSQVNETRSQQQLDFWQPSLHTRTPITETAQWRMNIARVTRQPSVWDLLDRAVPSQGDNSPTNPDQLGNPNLRPEVTQTFDIGVEQRLPGQGQAGLSLFMRRTGDVIATELFEQSGSWVSQRQNIGSAQTVGLEGDIKRPLASSGWARDWMLTANATVLQSRMSDGPREGTAIPGQPSYTLSLGAAKPMRRTGGTFGGLSASLNGPASLSTPTLSGRERSRITLDAHVGHSVPRKGFWRVGVYNLGDAPVERSRSYRDAGASINERSKTYYAPRIYASVGAQL
jgi:outer membrane receptor for ferrienterochelin and colicin